MGTSLVLFFCIYSPPSATQRQNVERRFLSILHRRRRRDGNRMVENPAQTQYTPILTCQKSCTHFESHHHHHTHREITSPTRTSINHTIKNVHTHTNTTTHLNFAKRTRDVDRQGATGHSKHQSAQTSSSSSSEHNVLCSARPTCPTPSTLHSLTSSFTSSLLWRVSSS